MSTLSWLQKPCCYGCGVRLQVTDDNAAGYVAPDKLAMKAQHKKQLQTVCMMLMSVIFSTFGSTALVCTLPSAQQWRHDPRCGRLFTKARSR